MKDVSRQYRFIIDQLTQAGGYERPDDARAHLHHAAAEHFFPEHIVGAFLRESPLARANPHAGQTAQKIGQSIFFQDGGVQAYAAPNAPLIFALTEVAAQKTASNSHTCYVLGSADISNLGGLNRATDRETADTLLAHLARIPEDSAQRWATEHGYRAELMTIRTGGDEFRYVMRLTCPKPIDPNALKANLSALTDMIHDNAEHFAQSTGMSGIAHSKPNRAAGVGITVALAPINGCHPNIPSMLDAMNTQIAHTRKERDATYTIPDSIAPLRVPAQMPTPTHRVESTHPYAGMEGWHPHMGESLETFAIRSALKDAAFDSLAFANDALIYDTERRQTRLNPLSEAVKALSQSQLHAANALLSAERLRGLVDPVTRCYSASHRDDIMGYYDITQQRTQCLHLDAGNLSGLNKISEDFGDAMLREVAKLLERNYKKHFENSSEKPAIVRGCGGEFSLILPKSFPRQSIDMFMNDIRKDMDHLTEQTIGAFASTHGKVSIGASPADMRICDIPSGRIGGKTGIHITCEQGPLHEQASQQARLA